MKQLLLILAILGISHSNINAQNSSNAKNYRVCRVDGVYHTCNDSDPLVVTTKPVVDKTNAAQASMRKYDTYTKVESLPISVMSNKKNKNIVISCNESDEINNGCSLQANVVLDATEARNANNLKTSNAALPLNDGYSDKH
jgi:hypothetical protein